MIKADYIVLCLVSYLVLLISSYLRIPVHSSGWKDKIIQYNVHALRHKKVHLPLLLCSLMYQLLSLAVNLKMGSNTQFLNFGI